MFQFRIDIIQPVMRRLDGILRHRHALHHLVMLFHFLFQLLQPEIGHPRAAEYSQQGTDKRPRQGQQRHNYSAVRNITSFLLRLQGEASSSSPSNSSCPTISTAHSSGMFRGKRSVSPRSRWILLW